MKLMLSILKGPDLRRQIAAGQKVVCLRTFSKIYGLGGLRVGYGHGDPRLIQLLHRVRQPFNEFGGSSGCDSGAEDHKPVDMCCSANESGRKQLVEGMQALGYTGRLVVKRILCFASCWR